MLRKGAFISDRYEITDKVGSGGMSDVYKAKDHKLNRYVAIKVLKAEFSEDKNFVSKFRVEAQSAAGLSHPNIVNVYDVGEDENENIHYIVMELIEGITLKKYIERKGQLPVKEAVSILIQVAQGIEVAHNNHIIHRDIKPQNIIISKEGKVKVTDFGIARAVSANTVSSNAMGSVHYISPEQAKGSFIDEKSDIYSLGITLYEMITGRVPFDGDSTVSIALQHIQNEMPSPDIYVENIPVSVKRIIEKCTMKKPDRRYLKVSSLIADLKRSLVTPDENFVTMVDLDDKSATQTISAEDVKKIRQEAGFERQQSNVPVIGDDEEFDDFGEYDDVDDDLQEELDEEENPKIDKIIAIGGIVMAVIIVVFVAFIAVKFLGNGCSSSGLSSSESELDADHRKVPDVSGMTKEEAIQTLKDNDLGYKITEETDNKVEAGYVIGTSPAAGDIVEKNSTVTIVVSLGSQAVNIPSGLIGASKDDAKAALEDAGFVVTVEYIADDSADIDVVVDVDPAEGTASYYGASVTLYISSGSDAATVEMPKVTGLSLDAAKASIEAKNLVVGNVTEDYSDTVESGKVISQSVTAKSSVPEGTSIDLVVSKGPDEKPEVPNLTGYTEADATSVLQGLGLNISVRNEYDNADVGTVCSQDVAAGTKVSKGTSIGVVISMGPEPTTETVTTANTVTVPNVVGFNVNKASSKIKNAGLSVEVKNEESSDVASGLVIRQDIPANTEVVAGQTVTIYVSSGSSASEETTPEESTTTPEQGEDSEDETVNEG